MSSKELDLRCDLDDAQFGQLLKMCFQRYIGMDDTISDTSIVGSIYGASGESSMSHSPKRSSADVSGAIGARQATIATASRLVDAASVLLGAAAASDWDGPVLSSALREKVDIEPKHAAVVEDFWRQARSKARAILATRTIWHDTAAGLRWRVGVTTASRKPHGAGAGEASATGEGEGEGEEGEEAEPKAVLELRKGARELGADAGGGGGSSAPLRVELSADELARLVGRVDEAIAAVEHGGGGGQGGGKQWT